jgi:hypothetical protein
VSSYRIARRTRSFAGAGAAGRGRPFAPSPAAAQLAPDEAEEPTPAERAAMAASARAFVQNYAVPGFSVAVGRPAGGGGDAPEGE